MATLNAEHSALPTAIPPLSQSRRGDMACELLYVQKHVVGIELGESQPAARGIEIHELLATYIDHLVVTKRRTDLEVFDTLTQGLGDDAREAISRFRNSHAFDPDKIVATELHIALDEDFRPIEENGDDARNASYEGTLDLVMLHSLTEAEIGDWKSYYQIIDADTFQSKLYPLLLMCLNPTLESVKFVLEFIRYGVSRWVEYTREDVPRLMDLARGERARQRSLHDLALRSSRPPKSSPGRHCAWCPLLLNGCPIAETNPYARMTREQRLRFALWLDEAEKENTRILKELLVEEGPIHYADDNQRQYVARFVPVEKKFYPYEQAAPIVEEWLKTHQDAVLLDSLTISGLSSLLKAEKRQALASELTTIAAVRLDTELKIGAAQEQSVTEGSQA
jgi:hypothetical protein